MEEEPIRAAGGVLWRERADGTIEVALVHRPEYDDWSLPKGKPHPGEDPADTALREVVEETGHSGTLGADLGEVRYRTGGRDKVVRWFAMAADSDPRELTHEVDAVRWFPLDDVDARTHYDTDREVLARFRAQPGVRAARR